MRPGMGTIDQVEDHAMCVRKRFCVLEVASLYSHDLLRQQVIWALDEGDRYQGV